jgi:putative redox protein
LEAIDVHLQIVKLHEDDKAGVTHPLEQITRTITLKGPLSEEQRERLLDVANKCPLYRTLTGQLRIGTALSAEVAA